MTTSVVVGSLIVAACALWVLYARGQTRNVLLAVAAFFALFAYGPAINLLTGNDVYFGINIAHVDVAVVGFALALIGIVIGDFIMPQRPTFDASTVMPGRRLYEPLVLIFVVLIGYGLFIIGTRSGAMLGADKLSAIAAAGPGHRIYLIIELCAVSTFFITRRSSMFRSLWVTNLTVYVSYCLITSERDFLLVLFAIVIHREMLNNRKRAWRLVGAAAGAVVGASALFSSRAGQQLDLTGVLNQGSILFVDTFVAGQVPAASPFQGGQTYLDTLTGILPTWIVDVGHRSLSSWLVDRYAPGSPGGYGFSLTGEAYMNFGLAGVPVLFCLLTLAHRFVVNRADHSDWWAYFSVFSTTIWMYALRGDSSQLLKSLLYGALFFAVISSLSTVHSARGGPALTRRSAPPLLGRQVRPPMGVLRT